MIPQSLYARLGGEPVLQEFVEQLYTFMQCLLEVQPIRNLHAKDLSHTQERLFLFLSGMLGGPSLYMEAFGPPRMRRRHHHLSIGNSERDQWLLCAEKAAKKLPISVLLQTELMQALNDMANHLRNQEISSTEQNVSFGCPVH
ncbi:MAG: group II truncated hemoglobin [Gammaproteobacteria bacterium]|nr:group II truncated hemoglobin [Gammaproteobacteria bacterium]